MWPECRTLWNALGPYSQGNQGLLNDFGSTSPGTDPMFSQYQISGVLLVRYHDP